MTPHLEIILPLEGRPYLQLFADNADDQARLFDWIDNHPGLDALLAHANELATKENA